MKDVKIVEDGSPGVAFDDWLEVFANAMAAQNYDQINGLFSDESYLRDLLALTWEFRHFEGRDEIQKALQSTLPKLDLRNIRASAQRSKPEYIRRSGRNLLEGYFEFDTNIGVCDGFVRLEVAAQGESPKIWHLVTVLNHIHGHAEKTGSERPKGDNYSQIAASSNWYEDWTAQQSYADREPEVLIIGGGQSGLMLAARLKQMGVDALVVERTERIGDEWRNRYNNLTLHNEIWANHFPYMEFPETWPVWLPKDMLAMWLESYAAFMELNVWTGTTMTESDYDAASGQWTAKLSRPGQETRTLHPKHIVAAVGISGGIGKKPSMPGLDDFSGTVLHSSEFGTGRDWADKNALVVGTGNSGHDVAQDLYVSGAENVSIMQRGATCIVSLEPSAAISYAVFGEGRPVEDVDIMVAGIPYPMLIDTYKFVTKRTNEHDQEMLEKLKAVGFKTTTGEDETGFQLLYLRGAGGYYIDVGCCKLIIDRKIGLLQADGMDRFVPEGVRMKDGTVTPLDLVVTATGFDGMHESIRRIMGDKVADKIGPIWGFDENKNMRNMWQRTNQEGFWVMGGAIIEARFYSRMLALQIKASLLGISPDAENLPLAGSTAVAE